MGMVMRLTVVQVYYLKRLVHGVEYDELRRWDQRALRGLHIRGMFLLTTRLDGRATQLGWDCYKATMTPKKRKDVSRPTFNHHQYGIRRRQRA